MWAIARQKTLAKIRSKSLRAVMIQAIKQEKLKKAQEMKKRKEQAEQKRLENQLRIQGDASQVEFYAGPAFGTPLPPDHQGKPRITINRGELGPGGATALNVYFRARKKMRTKDLKFKIGVYADIRPHGFDWKTDSPNY